MIKYITLFLFCTSLFSSPVFSKTECHNHGECSGGKGCYPSDPGNSSDKDDQFLIEWLFGRKEIGKGCSKDGECQSGSCIDVCKERESNGNCKKSVKECGEHSECMFAPIGEIAPSGVECEGHDDPSIKVTKDSKGKCTGGSFKWVVMIPDNVNVGSMEPKTCAVSYNEGAYKNFLNNFYSLAAFELMFQQPTTEGDCLPTTEQVRKKLALKLQVLHQGVKKAFKDNYFEGYMKPSEWLAKQGTEKDVNCGATQTLMANLHATHYMTNMVLLYGDRYKEKVYGSNSLPGLAGLPTGLDGYIDLFSKPEEISNEYFGYDWNHVGTEYAPSKDCRNINWPRFKRDWWQRRYNFPDGLPEDLLRFVGGEAANDAKKAADKVNADLAIAFMTGGLSHLAPVAKFSFLDPVLPSGMNFGDYCGGTFAGHHRRDCWKSDVEWEMARTNKPGMIYVFKDKAGEYFKDSISSESGAHLFGILTNDPSIKMEIARMSFGNLFWYSGNKAYGRHPIARRQVFFQLIQNNLYSLVNYLTKMNELRFKAMNCLYEASMKLQEMCYDPSINPSTTEYDKKNSGQDGKKGNPLKKNSQGVPGIAVGVSGFIPSFTSLITATPKSSSDKANSQLEQASFKSETLFNKAVEQRDRKIKEQLAKMSAKDKELNDQFNKGLKDINQLSSAALTAIMGAGPLNNSSSNNSAAQDKKNIIAASKKTEVVIDNSLDNMPNPSSSRRSGTEDSATNLNEVELEKMIQEAKDDKYNPTEGDGLFKIISKGYMKHGLHRLLKKKDIPDNEKDKEKFSPPKSKPARLDKLPDEI
jgi:hypothetical protein